LIQERGITQRLHLHLQVRAGRRVTEDAGVEIHHINVVRRAEEALRESVTLGISAGSESGAMSADGRTFAGVTNIADHGPALHGSHGIERGRLKIAVNQRQRGWGGRRCRGWSGSRCRRRRWCGRCCRREYHRHKGYRVNQRIGLASSCADIGETKSGGRAVSRESESIVPELNCVRIKRLCVRRGNCLIEQCSIADCLHIHLQSRSG